MKRIVPLVLGFLVGVALFAFGLTHNPFLAKREASPISVSDNAVTSLSFDSVAARSVFLTNNGKSRMVPNPKDAQRLWEAPVRLSQVMLTVLNDAPGQPAGLGLKFSSRSEKTRLLYGEALVDSVWYVYLPGRGSLFIDQTENYWGFINDIVIPAYKNSANSWKGSWFGDLTIAPGARGAARVTGGSGALQGSELAAVESLSVTAYSADIGPVVAEGRLLIKKQAD
ncbi:MAG: hypothetical protein KJN77_01335 [Gammaproteobacteria bacterium]|nr:hypothetical protein [Gammaproteobacteria bacterium]